MEMKMRNKLHFSAVLFTMVIASIFGILSSSSVNATAPKTKRVKFTSEEDKKLKKLVEEWGECWGIIAKNMPNRNGRQCRERWQYSLSPNISAAPWTKEEDKLLLQKQKELGNRWAIMIKYFSGRNRKQLKNRYHLLTKHEKISSRNPQIGATGTLSMYHPIPAAPPLISGQLLPIPNINIPNILDAPQQMELDITPQMENEVPARSLHNPIPSIYSIIYHIPNEMGNEILTPNLTLVIPSAISLQH